LKEIAQSFSEYLLKSRNKIQVLQQQLPYCSTTDYEFRIECALTGTGQTGYIMTAALSAGRAMKIATWNLESLNRLTQYRKKTLHSAMEKVEAEWCGC